MQNSKQPARQLQRVKGVYMYSYCNVANCAGSGLNGYKHFMCEYGCMASNYVAGQDFAILF